MFDPDVFRMESKNAFESLAFGGHEPCPELDRFDQYKMALPPVVSKPPQIVNPI